VSLLPSEHEPKLGLRERKKARTRAAIQRHALRLFKEQGYDATTIEQIVDAAEVSESTFFRYFPAKEDVVLYDESDPLVFRAFLDQPADLGPVAAMRAAYRQVFAGFSEQQREDQWERFELIVSVPQLRSAELLQFFDMVPIVSALLAERLGRPDDDLPVRTLTGAVIGVAFSVLFTADRTKSWDELMDTVDDALAYLETGFSI
jgi:AcrR family transcriptional regulator